MSTDPRAAAMDALLDAALLAEHGEVTAILKAARALTIAELEALAQPVYRHQLWKRVDARIEELRNQDA